MCRAKKRQQYNFITNYIIKERNNIFEVLKEKKNKAHNLEFYYQKRYPSKINVKLKKKSGIKNEKLISSILYYKKWYNTFFRKNIRNLTQKKFIKKESGTLKKININNIKYILSSMKFSQHILTFKENIIIILF